MMAQGKMGPRGRRARPQTEPSAEGRGRVRCQNYLLIEPLAVLSIRLRLFNRVLMFFNPRSAT